MTRLTKSIWSFILVFSILATTAVAQLQPLSVSKNGRFIVTSDGKPFFYLADTGWELIHKLTREESEAYFKKRTGQGFTVIQTVVLAELDGLRTPNAYGNVPFNNGDPASPNEEYFKHVDYIIDLAARNNLYIALLPTWGDKVFKNSWGIGPEIFNPDNVYLYGKWIGARYKDKTNIIWINGGDRDPRDNSQDVAIWRALAKGLTEGVGAADRALITFHPQPELPAASSSTWFHKDDWLDFNMLQTGHCRDTPVWESTGADYNRNPVKPVINGESIYEEMPVCFNARELGYASAYDVRKAAYFSVFAGACGHTYGSGPVIFFGEKGSIRFADLHGWKDALDFAGANEMKFLRYLIESRPMLDRIPDQSMIVGDAGSAPERIQATRGKDYAFIYSAYGRPIAVRLGRISGKKVTANWFDPRTGQTKHIGLYDNVDSQTFTPPLPQRSPVPSQRQDWVLVLDDAGKNYAMPTIP